MIVPVTAKAAVRNRPSLHQPIAYKHIKPGRKNGRKNTRKTTKRATCFMMTIAINDTPNMAPMIPYMAPIM
jgi:hypothetical protein